MGFFFFFALKEMFWFIWVTLLKSVSLFMALMKHSVTEAITLGKLLDGKIH